MRKRSLFWILAVLLCFLLAVARLDHGRRTEGKQQLEDALRRTAVSCYALEGFYPPSVDYMKKNYALQYEEDAYTVYYEVIASNLMPDITVLEKQP